MSRQRIAPNELRTRLHGERCIYCGMRATQDEHWPPYSSSETGFILPACSECNAFAGTDYPANFIERAKFVKSKLATKYARELRIADISCEELATQPRSTWLPTLESFREKVRILQRLEWNALSYIAVIDLDEVFTPQFTLSIDNLWETDDADEKSG